MTVHPISAAGLAAFICLDCGIAAAAQADTPAYPVRPIRIIVPTAAGGPTDITARAIGPSLGAAGISNPLADPMLELRDANGDLVQSNDDWEQGPDHDAISDEGLAPANTKESAILATLTPAGYTVLVSGINGATGIGLVEIYDNSPAPP